MLDKCAGLDGAVCLVKAVPVVNGHPPIAAARIFGQVSRRTHGIDVEF